MAAVKVNQVFRLKAEGKNMRDRKLLKAIKLDDDSYPSAFSLST